MNRVLPVICSIVCGDRVLCACILCCDRALCVVKHYVLHGVLCNKALRVVGRAVVKHWVAVEEYCVLYVVERCVLCGVCCNSCNFFLRQMRVTKKNRHVLYFFLR